MKRDIKFIIICLAGILVLYITKTATAPGPWQSLGVSIGIEFAAAPLLAFLVDATYSFRRLPLWYKTKLLYRYSEVRLSIAYLFRIEVDGRYLLVKNRHRDLYQLVGGAYKAYPKAKAVFDKYGVIPDKQFETSHGIAKSDLRFLVPGRNVFAILSWFHSQKDRETSQWREFCEELLTTNLLSKELFRYIDYTYACTIQTPMRKAKRLPNQEILLFEIYDLVPTTEQQIALKQLLLQGDTVKIKWAEKQVIDALGTDHRLGTTPYEIGPHTKWALNEKWEDD